MLKVVSAIVKIRRHTMGLQTDFLTTSDKCLVRAGVWKVRENKALRGYCILLQGLSEFLEKYEEVANELNARGFEVLSFDWRGQGGSDRRAPGMRKIHVTDFEEYDRDLRALLRVRVQDMVASGLPIIALGHSMGAHLLLRYLRDDPKRLACAVLVGPMLDIDTAPYPGWVAKATAGFYNLQGPSIRFVFGCEANDPATAPFEGNRYTTDPARFKRTADMLKANPLLKVSGPTFSWLSAAFRSMKMTGRTTFAEDIVTPLLVFGAKDDKIVKTDATRGFLQYVPNAHYVELENARHEMLMERDDIRARFWDEFDVFVEKYAFKR